MLLDQDFTQATHDDAPKTILRINEKKRELNEQLKSLTQARAVIALLAAFNAVVATYYYFSDAAIADVYYVVEVVLVVSVYAACAVFLPRRPGLAIGVVLGVFVFYQLIAALDDPTTLFKGWLLKAIVFYWLIRGLLAVRRLRKYEAQLIKLGVARREVELAVSQLKEISRTRQVHTARAKRGEAAGARVVGEEQG